jgi:hypothetical protein
MPRVTTVSGLLNRNLLLRSISRQGEALDYPATQLNILRNFQAQVH